MLVALQAQAPIRADLNSFDLEARAFLEDGVRAPGTLHSHMQHVLGRGPSSQLFDDLAHFLAATAARDKYRVRSLDNGNALEVNGRNEAAMTANQCIATLDWEHVALN